ncbi:MAG: NUDIX hydrolase [Caulobacteraceae bacterium]
MRERLTARVLLFDCEGRLLLMKGRLPGLADAPGAWFTIGGGVEPGETAREAAAREIVEETGFTDAVLGPQVWYGEILLSGFEGEPLLFKDSYFVAHCAGGPPSRHGWQALEREYIDDIRWWRLGDLAACEEPVYPKGLADLAGEIAAGTYPADPRIISAL